jgi:hypothetical protein
MGLLMLIVVSAFHDGVVGICTEVEPDGMEAKTEGKREREREADKADKAVAEGHEGSCRVAMFLYLSVSPNILSKGRHIIGHIPVVKSPVYF